MIPLGSAKSAQERIEDLANDLRNAAAFIGNIKPPYTQQTITDISNILAIVRPTQVNTLYAVRSAYERQQQQQ